MVKNSSGRRGRRSKHRKGSSSFLSSKIVFTLPGIVMGVQSSGCPDVCVRFTAIFLKKMGVQKNVLSSAHGTTGELGSTAPPHTVNPAPAWECPRLSLPLNSLVGGTPHTSLRRTVTQGIATFPFIHMSHPRTRNRGGVRSARTLISFA